LVSPTLRESLYDSPQNQIRPVQGRRRQSASARQFRNGQSGNPGGRPPRNPAQRLKALTLQEAYRPIVIMEDGRAVPVTAIEAILCRQVELAAKGNVQAQRAILAAVLQEGERAGGNDARDPPRHLRARIRDGHVRAQPDAAERDVEESTWREGLAVRRIPKARICERNSLFGAMNSLFRTEQGIQQNPLTSNDKKGLTGVETRSEQGIFENSLLSGSFRASLKGALSWSGAISRGGP
jgi:hypothetical protein